MCMISTCNITTLCLATKDAVVQAAESLFCLCHCVSVANRVEYASAEIIQGLEGEQLR